MTGKPLIIGGSVGRREATGRGIVYTLYQAARRLGQELRGRRVVVQGFGNVGSVAARLLWREGCVIAGVSDVRGGIWNPSGLDIRQLEAHVAEAGTVMGFPGADAVDNMDLLCQPCDVLIPAAVGSVIRGDNADRIKASIVAEGANGPTTPEGDVILRERGVTVIPDILANAGGVVVSYFEWVQGLQYYFWRESEITSRLQEVMTRAFNRVWALATKEGTDLQDGRPHGRDPARGGGLPGPGPVSVMPIRCSGGAPDVAKGAGGRLGRRLVDEDPAQPVDPLGLRDDLDVPVVVVPDGRPVALEGSVT